MRIGLIAADDMSDVEQAMLYEFARDTTHAAYRAQYVTTAWSPSDAMCERLRGYHQAGLTPDEAAEGLFGVHH